MKKGQWKEDTKGLFYTLKKTTQKDLLGIFRQIDSPEEAAGLLVPNCPVCGGINTKDCGPQISADITGEVSLVKSKSPLDDSTVGICLDCGAMGCLECGETFKEGQTSCEHWQVCDACEFERFASKNDELCEIPAWECSIIQEWKGENNDG